MIDKLVKFIRAAKHVYLCGNGGSAANAIHIANDLIAAGVRAHALTADVATLTAIANDYGYNKVFSRQIEVFGQKGDLLIVLSGSGCSQNIINALARAADKKMRTVSVFGAYNIVKYDWADLRIWTGNTMQAAEEYQLFLGHALMRRLRAKRS